MMTQVHKAFNWTITVTLIVAYCGFAMLMAENPALQINSLERNIIEDNEGHLIMDAQREICSSKPLNIEVRKRVVNDKTGVITKLTTTNLHVEAGCVTRHSNFYLPDILPNSEYRLEVRMLYDLNLLRSERLLMPELLFQKPADDSMDGYE